MRLLNLLVLATVLFYWSKGNTAFIRTPQAANLTQYCYHELLCEIESDVYHQFELQIIVTPPDSAIPCDRVNEFTIKCRYNFTEYAEVHCLCALNGANIASKPVEIKVQVNLSSVTDIKFNGSFFEWNSPEPPPLDGVDIAYDVLLNYSNGTAGMIDHEVVNVTAYKIPSGIECRQLNMITIIAYVTSCGSLSSAPENVTITADANCSQPFYTSLSVDSSSTSLTVDDMGPASPINTPSNNNTKEDDGSASSRGVAFLLIPVLLIISIGID